MLHVVCHQPFVHHEFAEGRLLEAHAQHEAGWGAIFTQMHR